MAYKKDTTELSWKSRPHRASRALKQSHVRAF